MSSHFRTLLLISSILLLFACNGGSSDTTDVSLRKQFLSKVFEAKADAFVNDEAALIYLKNYCESAQTQNPPTKDQVDKIVWSYCETDLAIEAGVVPTTKPKAIKNFDEVAYRKAALDQFGVGTTEADGSSLDAVWLGQSLCDANIALLKSNLGKDFDGSFQKFALSTFCPEKLK
jgi:hypothetical protein